MDHAKARDGSAAIKPLDLTRVHRAAAIDFSPKWMQTFEISMSWECDKRCLRRFATRLVLSALAKAERVRHTAFVIEKLNSSALVDDPASSPADRRRGARTALPKLLQPGAMSLAPDLAGAVGFRLRRATALADAIFAEVFGPLNVTTRHYAILVSIRHMPDCRPSALSALLNITPNNLVPHIDGLVERGYVRRSDSDNDRRIKQLRLTSDGEALVVRLIAKHEEVRARVEARMGAENVAKLLELLTLYSG